MFDLLAVFSDRHHICGDSVTHPKCYTSHAKTWMAHEMLKRNHGIKWAALGQNSRVTWNYMELHFHTNAEPILSHPHCSAWNIHFIYEIGDRLLLKFVASVVLHISILFSVSGISVFMYVTYMKVLSNNKLCWCPIHLRTLNELVRLCVCRVPLYSLYSYIRLYIL